MRLADPWRTGAWAVGRPRDDRRRIGAVTQPLNLFSPAVSPQGEPIFVHRAANAGRAASVRRLPPQPSREVWSQLPSAPKLVARMCQTLTRRPSSTLRTVRVPRVPRSSARRTPRSKTLRQRGLTQRDGLPRAVQRRQNLHHRVGKQIDLVCVDIADAPSLFMSFTGERTRGLLSPAPTLGLCGHEPLGCGQVCLPGAQRSPDQVQELRRRVGVD